MLGTYFSDQEGSKWRELLAIRRVTAVLHCAVEKSRSVGFACNDPWQDPFEDIMQQHAWMHYIGDVRRIVLKLSQVSYIVAGILH